MLKKFLRCFVAFAALFVTLDVHALRLTVARNDRVFDSVATYDSDVSEARSTTFSFKEVWYLYPVDPTDLDYKKMNEQKVAPVANGDDRILVTLPLGLAALRIESRSVIKNYQMAMNEKSTALSTRAKAFLKAAIATAIVSPLVGPFSSKWGITIFRESIDSDLEYFRRAIECLNTFDQFINGQSIAYPDHQFLEVGQQKIYIGALLVQSAINFEHGL